MCDELYQRLKDLHKLVNQYFEMNIFGVQNHSWVKDPFKMQKRPMNFFIESALIWFHIPFETNFNETITCQTLVQYQLFSYISM